MIAIIVTGPPAAGKTVLARRLSCHLHIPFFSRDAIKERLFDSLGVQDREWSMQLGAASYSVLFSVAESMFAARQTCILETNFSAAAAVTLTEIAERHGFALLQVFCTADVATLIERFERRAQSADRHPGHVDQKHVSAEGLGIFTAAAEPLALAGPLLVVDAADFAGIDYGDVGRRVKAEIRQAHLTRNHIVSPVQTVKGPSKLRV